MILTGSLIGVLVSGGLLVMFLTAQVREVSQAEARAREALRQAETANRAKSEFLANMNHELRTPLNAIIGFAEILKQEMFGPIENPRYRDYVSDIHESGRHLLTIIGDLLDLAKIEAGKLELQEEDVDIAQAIDLAVRIVRPDGSQPGPAFEVKLGPGLPRLRGDPRLIRQMVLNLLSNAVKFTPAGGTVTVEADIARDGQLVLRIVDTGVGMARDEIATALSPFGQISPAGNGKNGGTGLGLPLVKAFADLHGARFVIDSQPHVGTVATTFFPAERVLARQSTG